MPEAELHAAVCIAQDMLYTTNILLSLRLFVELPMELELENMVAVHLSNNWSVSGRTRYIDVGKYFRWELKEKILIVAKLTPGAKHIADCFTKNLSGSQFKEFEKVFVKEDGYTPESG